MPGKPWGVYAFLAGDNSLSKKAHDDLREMERVGTGPDVHVIAQIDRSPADDSPGGWRNTRRYRVQKGADDGRVASELMIDLGETNTGDASVLDEFVRAAVADAPVERAAIILWNHGSGFYVPPEMLALNGVGASERGRAAAGLRRAFFHGSRADILARPRGERGILYDDGSGDCLDNRELKATMAGAAATLGHKVDLLGLDACLMTMVEVAWPVREHVAVLVGSEEEEPGDGWPYDLVLGDLAATPTMSPDDLARSIVRRYIECYDDDPTLDVTQSAVKTASLTSLVGAIDDLADALLARAADGDEQPAVLRARWRATRFYSDLYVDIGDFAAELAARAVHATVRDAAAAVGTVLRDVGGRSPLLAEAHAGPRMGKVSGLSIYFPPSFEPAEAYDELDFARDTRWRAFLKGFLE